MNDLNDRSTIQTHRPIKRRLLRQVAAQIVDMGEWLIDPQGFSLADWCHEFGAEYITPAPGTSNDHLIVRQGTTGPSSNPAMPVGWSLKLTQEEAKAALLIAFGVNGASRHYGPTALIAVPRYCQAAFQSMWESGRSTDEICQWAHSVMSDMVKPAQP